MLDARTSQESVSIEHFDTAHPVGEAHNRSEQNQDNQVGPQERPQMKMITEDEIVGQAFVFLVAGYETSSNTLAFACYLLAINPECQRELQKEVDHFFTRHVSEAVCHHVNLCRIKRKTSNSPAGVAWLYKRPGAEVFRHGDKWNSALVSPWIQVN